MTSGTELESAGDAVAAKRSVSTGTVSSSSAKKPLRATSRRGFAGTLAALSVVGLSAAIVAPTGMALADPPAAELETSFSLAAQDTQDLTVTAEGATIAPMERGAYDVYVTPTPTPEPEPEPEPEVASSPSDSGSAGPMYYTGGGAPAEWMAAAGIASGDWGYVDYVVSRESGWNPNAINSSSGACGLVQIMPLHGVADCHNPVVNLRWGHNYATGRYGSWEAAVTFWKNNHWW